MGKENQLLEAAASGNLVKVEVSALCNVIVCLAAIFFYIDTAQVNFFVVASLARSKRLCCFVCKYAYSASPGLCKYI